jgi:hypothetical protein
LEVVFISYLCTLWFDPISLGFKFDLTRPVVAEIINFSHFEVIFHTLLSSIGGRLHCIPSDTKLNLHTSYAGKTHRHTKYMNAGVAFALAGIRWVLAGKLEWARLTDSKCPR